MLQLRQRVRFHGCGGELVDSDVSLPSLCSVHNDNSVVVVGLHAVSSFVCRQCESSFGIALESISVGEERDT